ncbi:unnamed protein product [Urochloa humidicola]
MDSHSSSAFTPAFHLRLRLRLQLKQEDERRKSRKRDGEPNGGGRDGYRRSVTVAARREDRSHVAGLFHDQDGGPNCGGGDEHRWLLLVGSGNSKTWCAFSVDGTEVDRYCTVGAAFGLHLREETPEQSR